MDRHTDQLTDIQMDRYRCLDKHWQMCEQTDWQPNQAGHLQTDRSTDRWLYTDKQWDAQRDESTDRRINAQTDGCTDRDGQKENAQTNMTMQSDRQIESWMYMCTQYRNRHINLT